MKWLVLRSNHWAKPTRELHNWYPHLSDNEKMSCDKVTAHAFFSYKLKSYFCFFMNYLKIKTQTFKSTDSWKRTKSGTALFVLNAATRGGARGGLRGLKPRMFSEKPRMFLWPCPVRIIITEFSCALKWWTAVYSRQEPPTEARTSDWHIHLIINFI